MQDQQNSDRKQSFNKQDFDGDNYNNGRNQYNQGFYKNNLNGANNREHRDPFENNGSSNQRNDDQFSKDDLQNNRPYVKKGFASQDNYANRLNPNNVHYAGNRGRANAIAARHPNIRGNLQFGSNRGSNNSRGNFQRYHHNLNRRSQSPGKDNYNSQQDIRRQQFERQPSNSPPQSSSFQNHRIGRFDQQQHQFQHQKESYNNNYGNRGMQQGYREYQGFNKRIDGGFQKFNQIQNEYQIYVHNVDFEVTANQVVDKFRQCGDILKWHFPRKDHGNVNHGRHRGYGFICFKTEQGQLEALKMKDNPPIVGRRAISIGINLNIQNKTDHDQFQRKEATDDHQNRRLKSNSVGSQEFDRSSKARSVSNGNRQSNQNTNKRDCELKMDSQTLEIIKKNKQTNQNDEIGAPTDNQGKKIDIESLKKDNDSMGKVINAKDDSKSQEDQGEKYSKNLRGLIGSIMDMRDDQNSFTSNLNKDDNSHKDEKANQNGLHKNISMVDQNGKKLDEVPKFQRTETRNYDDIQDSRDAFDIAVLEDDQLEPDEVVKQNNDEADKEKSSNHKENESEEQLKEKSVRSGQASINNDIAPSERQEQKQSDYHNNPQAYQNQSNKNSYQNYYNKTDQQSTYKIISRGGQNFDSQNRYQHGMDSRQNYQNYQYYRNQNKYPRNNWNRYNRDERPSSNDERRNFDRDKNNFERVNNDGNQRDNFNRDNYSKDDYNKNNYGRNYDNDRDNFVNDRNNHYRNRDNFGGDRENLNKDRNNYDRVNNDDKYRQLGKRNQPYYNNDYRSNDEYVRNNEQPRNPHFRQDDNFHNNNQRKEQFQPNRNRESYNYIERERQNQDNNEVDRREFQEHNIRSRSPNDFDNFGSSNQYKRQKHEFSNERTQFSQKRHQSQTRPVTQFRPTDRQSQEFMNDGNQFRDQGADSFQQEMQRFQRQSGRNNQLNQMSEEALAQQMFFAQGLAFQNQARFPGTQFDLQQGPNGFDPRAFQAFFEKDPSKKGKIDALRQAQFAAQMAQFSRMMNPQLFQNDSLFQHGPSALMQEMRAPFGQFQQMVHPMVNDMYRDRDEQNYGEKGFKQKNNMEDGDYDDGIDNYDFDNDNEQSVSFHDTLIKENFKSPQAMQAKQGAKPLAQIRKKPQIKKQSRQTNVGKWNN